MCVLNGRYVRNYRFLPPARTHACAAAEAVLARSLKCARVVWRETPPWVPFGAAPPQVTRLTPLDNPLQTVPFLIARYDDAWAKSTHARALRLRRRSLARSIGRARCGGGGSVRLHRPSRALCAPRAKRVNAYVITAHRARHHRFPSPPCTTGTPALQRRRRSLAHSIARARCGGGGGDGGCGRSRRT